MAKKDCRMCSMLRAFLSWPNNFLCASRFMLCVGGDVERRRCAWSLAKRRAGLTTPTGLPSSKPIEPPRRQERQGYQQPQRGCHLQSPGLAAQRPTLGTENHPPSTSSSFLLPHRGRRKEEEAWNLAKLWAELKKSKKSIFIFEFRLTLIILMHKPHYAEIQPTLGGALCQRKSVEKLF